MVETCPKCKIDSPIHVCASCWSVLSPDGNELKKATQALIDQCKKFPGLNSDTEDVVKWLVQLTRAGKNAEAALEPPKPATEVNT